MALLDRAKTALRALRGLPAVRTGVELAWGGEKITGGIIRDDHVASLWGVKGIQTAAKMRRSSAQVRCTERVIGLPIRSTVWLVEEPDQASAAEKEAAELLRENLFGGMETSWDAVLREACLAVYFGFRVPEIVWEEREGALAVQKLASRNPELVDQWLYDEQGKLVGYLYVGNRPRGQGLEAWASVSATTYERLPIPLEKTVHFAYESENENPQGFGLWRSMYKHWYILEAVYKVLAIGIERNLLDVPVGKLPPGSQENDKQNLLTILSRWRAAEDAAVVLPQNTELEMLGSSRALVDAMPYLYHHDVKIAQAGLAAFMNLGQSEVGTQAVGVTLARMFETSVDATAGWIEDCLNTQLVHRWTQANYGPDYRQRGFRAPRLTHKPIRSNDLTVWSSALSALLSGGLLHATVDDEEYVRDLLELPAVPREQLELLEEERQVREEEQRNAELLRLQGTVGDRSDAGLQARDSEGGWSFGSASQPRAPKGSSIGGQWVAAGGGTAGIVNTRQYGPVSMREATAEDRKRLGIPPGYTDARVADKEDAPLQWTAVAATGKVKYGYSTEHVGEASVAKFERVKAVHEKLPGMRAEWDREIAGGGKNAHEALALRLISQAGFRNGGDEAQTGIIRRDAEGKPVKDAQGKTIKDYLPTYGASTLLTSHARTEGDRIHFDFVGKSGVRQRHSLTDPVLAAHIRARQAEGHTTLFDTSDARTRDYLKKTSGEDFKVHDLRTRHATATAAAVMGRIDQRGEAPQTAKEYAKQRQRALKIAARRIGDSVTVAEKNYVDPHVFGRWEAGLSGD